MSLSTRTGRTCDETAWIAGGPVADLDFVAATRPGLSASRGEIDQMPVTSLDIRILEPRWEGAFHAPFNAAMLATIHSAWPRRGLTFVGVSSHLEQVRAKLASEVRDAVRFVALDEEPLVSTWSPYRWKTRRDAHPIRQAWRAFRLLRAVVRLGGTAQHLVLTSADASVLNGLWLDRVSRRPRRSVEVVLHGQLNDVAEWRSRRPGLRLLDFTSALTRWNDAGGTITVLEEHIREALVAQLPNMGQSGTVRVLPHPTPGPGRPPGQRAPTTPLQVGFLGVATQAKGIESYVRLATELRDDPGVRFRIAGFLTQPVPEVDFSVLDDPVSRDVLSRAHFEQIVAALDYVCLPLSGAYYRYAASGTFLDAVEHLKPVITLDCPLTRRIFEVAGDIGYLCADEDALTDTVRRLAAHPDADRYRRQVEGLLRLRESRTPAALARSLETSWFTEGATVVR